MQVPTKKIHATADDRQTEYLHATIIWNRVRVFKLPNPSVEGYGPAIASQLSAARQEGFFEAECPIDFNLDNAGRALYVQSGEYLKETFMVDVNIGEQKMTVVGRHASSATLLSVS